LDALTAHGVLFLSSLLAATMLPGSSEATLLALAAAQPDQTVALTATATLGNTLGAVINWCLGRWLLHFADRPWFPASPKRVEEAARLFRRYGTWSLLFSWGPIVGDPLTLVAGVLRVPFGIFLPITALGKLVRYVLVIGAGRAIGI
jgi:membrane protein YqaA with SNARE-associated domain